MLVTYRDGDELVTRECSILVPVHVPGLCDRCAAPLTGRQTRWCSRACSLEWERNHDWTSARRRRKQLDGHRCVRCGSPEQLEVNHLIPRLGRGYGWGCHHHQALLETVCHVCHLLITAEQRAQRRLSAGPDLYRRTGEPRREPRRPQRKRR